MHTLIKTLAHRLLGLIQLLRSCCGSQRLLQLCVCARTKSGRNKRTETTSLSMVWFFSGEKASRPRSEPNAKKLYNCVLNQLLQSAAMMRYIKKNSSHQPLMLMLSHDCVKVNLNGQWMNNLSIFCSWSGPNKRIKDVKAS